MTLSLHGKHLIAGTWVDSPDRFENAPVSGPRTSFAVGSVALVDAACTAAAVAFAGIIGFIGLVVPHLVRLGMLKLGWGNDQRLLLPAAALAGGSLLVLADTLARSVMAPQQLPVGVLTALLGVPVFLFLLGRQRGTRS